MPYFLPHTTPAQHQSFNKKTETGQLLTKEWFLVVESANDYTRLSISYAFSWWFITSKQLETTSSSKLGHLILRHQYWQNCIMSLSELCLTLHSPCLYWLLLVSVSPISGVPQLPRWGKHQMYHHQKPCTRSRFANLVVSANSTCMGPLCKAMAKYISCYSVLCGQRPCSY